MTDVLKTVIDSWSHADIPQDQYADPGWYSILGNRYDQVNGILKFTRGQEVVDQMRAYNKQMGNPLTDEELAAGLNKFSKAQYDQYHGGYAVDSDPFNIGRWAVATALIDKGSPDAATALIRATDGQQAITSQQAMDIGTQAVNQIHNLDAQRAATQYQWNSEHNGSQGGGLLGEIGDFVTGAALPIAMTAVGGPVMGAIIGGAKAAGTGGNILTGALLGGAGGLLANGASFDLGAGTSFGSFLTGSETASLGSGISAGAGGITGATATGAGITGATVGSAAGLGSGAGLAAGLTGNALADKILGDIPASAARNIATQALMNDGKVDLDKLVTGVIAGGFGTALNPYVAELGLDPAVTKGITSGIVGTGMGLIQGQDLGTAVTGGLINGVATTVGNVAATAAHDAVSGSSFADVLSPDIAGSIAGTVAGNITGTVLNNAVGGGSGSAPVVDVPPVTPAAPTAAGVSFDNALPQNVTDADRSTDWTGNRLTNAGRI